MSDAVIKITGKSAEYERKGQTMSGSNRGWRHIAEERPKSGVDVLVRLGTPEYPMTIAYWNEDRREWMDHGTAINDYEVAGYVVTGWMPLNEAAAILNDASAKNGVAR